MITSMLIARGKSSDPDVPYRAVRPVQEDFWGIELNGRIVIPCTMVRQQAERRSARI